MATPPPPTSTGPGLHHGGRETSAQEEFLHHSLLCLRGGEESSTSFIPSVGRGCTCLSAPSLCPSSWPGPYLDLIFHLPGSRPAFSLPISSSLSRGVGGGGQGDENTIPFLLRSVYGLGLRSSISRVPIALFTSLLRDSGHLTYPPEPQFPLLSNGHI